MSHDDKPGAPDAQGGAPSGKLIEEDVFLARLAARQEASAIPEDQGEALSALAAALKSLGIVPDSLRSGGVAPPSIPPFTGGAGETLDAEGLAVEELFLSELSAGNQPRLGDYLQRYPRQRDALLRLAARMDPRELAGLIPQDELPAERQSAADRGQREGELRALRALESATPPRRRRGGMVAEERAEYSATPPSGKKGGKSHATRTRRSGRARPERSEPER